MKSHAPLSSKKTIFSDYEHNALLQLVYASGVGVISLLLISVSLTIIRSDFFDHITNQVVHPEVSIQSWAVFKVKPWTLFTYFWVDASFWRVLSNMIWLYCFGSVVQNLIGYKEIISLYIFTQLVGGVAFMFANQIWGVNSSFMGAQAGVIGMAIAALTLSPNYTYHWGESLNIKLWVVFIVYMAISALPVIYTNFRSPQLFLQLGGAFAGFVYMIGVKNGITPGKYIYDGIASLSKMVTPDEKNNRQFKYRSPDAKIPTKNMTLPYSDEYIDSLLDKINTKGMQSLSPEEKDILKKYAERQD